MAIVNLSAIAGGTGGFSILGRNSGFNPSSSGYSVSGLGDINGDGFDDFIVGSPGDFGDDDGPTNNNYSGAAFVIFGRGTPFASPLDLNLLAPTEGFQVNGFAGNVTQDLPDQLGFAVAGAGDFNNDGFDDILVGAPGAAGGDNGAIHLILGHTGLPVTFTDVNVPGPGFANGLAANDRLGWAVSSAGDFNGDGRADLIVGSLREGDAYVILGGSTAVTNLATLAADGKGFVIQGPPGGGGDGPQQRTPPSVTTFVSDAGDVNGDGFDDVIVGQRDTNGTAGRSFVLFGRSNGSSPFVDVDLNAALTGIGFQINGEAGSTSGSSVSSAGDVNGDGFDDLIVGGFLADGTQGASYLVFGHAGAPATFPTLNLGALAPAAGFKILGQTVPDESGWSVSSAGDYNDDGFADLLIGAPFADGVTAGDDFAGRAYIVYGRPDLSGPIDLDNIESGTGGVAFIGETGFDFAGFSVATAGDVNGDGADDVIIGAHAAFGGSGVSYVAFGAPNVAPVNTLPVPQTGAEDTTFAIPGLSVADVNDPALAVTLSVLNGTLTATPQGGTIVTGSGTGSMTLEGLIADVVATLGTVFYTVNADYNGGDTLTMLSDDGEDTDSDPLALTITEVNDAPAGTDDVLSSIAEDSGVRIIPFAALLGNDSTGPANEAGQSLTITSVGNAVGGTVSIVGTDVHFAPDPNFNGPASFDYTLEDNGTTNGAADPLDATAQVSFDVTPVPELGDDFDGNGTGDILWRNEETGFVAVWEMVNGEIAVERGVGFMPPASDPLGFEVAGTGDLNGDGTTDVLWRQNNGYVVGWEIQDGGLVVERGIAPRGLEFEIVETGDFNGDGTTDILWRHEGGAVSLWEMANGQLAVERGLSSAFDLTWNVAETGDFNGDGTTDILWRQDGTGALALWEMENGAIAVEKGVTSFDTSWELVEEGDFNGDATADILWRQDTGAVAIFEMQDGAVAVTRGFVGFPDTWDIAAANDVTGDGTTDIIWRNNDTGFVALWEMQNGLLFAERAIDESSFNNTWEVI